MTLYPPSLSKAARRLRKAVNDFDAAHPEFRPLTEDLRSATHEALTALEWGHDVLKRRAAARAPHDDA